MVIEYTRKIERFREQLLDLQQDRIFYVSRDNEGLIAGTEFEAKEKQPPIDLALLSITAPEKIKPIILRGGSNGVSRLILEASPDMITTWGASFAAFRDMRIFCRAPNLDNTLGLFLLFLRCDGVDNLERYNAWVDLARNTKIGNFHRIGAPSVSLSWLISALGHGYFGDDEIESANFQKNFASALIAVLELMTDALEAEANTEGVDPSNIVPSIASSNMLRRAQAFQRLAKDRYEKIVASSHVVQLLVPVAEGRGHMLVDALLASDRRPIGDVREFALYDEEHTWRRQGFSIIASYQESAAATRYGYSISVLDDRLGTTLSPLAVAIQNHELRKSGHPANKTAKWLSDHNDTFVRTDSQSPVSVLDWKSDILDVIWNELNPASLLKVNVWSAKPGHEYSDPVPFSDINRLSENKSEKHFCAVRWAKASQREDLPGCPTFDRILVALLSQTSGGNFPKLSDLPPIGSYEKLSIPGGFALIHNDGAFLFDDWTKDDIPFKSYFDEFEQVRKRYETIGQFHDRYKAFEEYGRIVTGQGDKKSINKIFDALISEVAKFKCDLAQLHADTLSLPNGYHLRVFRSALEKHWNVGEQLLDLTKSADQLFDGLETLFKHEQDLRAFKWQRISKVLTWGVTAAVASHQVTAYFLNTQGWKLVASFAGFFVGAVLAWYFTPDRHANKSIDGFSLDSFKKLGGA